MQTALADFIRDTPAGREADQILRACVHCGFCTGDLPHLPAAIGDELDGPRGRIYQIKQVLEGEPANKTVRSHLDRCLSCRSCETTCPSGVNYHRLLDIGREQVERQVPRSLSQKILRRLLIETLAYPKRFTPLLRSGGNGCVRCCHRRCAGRCRWPGMRVVLRLLRLVNAGC